MVGRKLKAASPKKEKAAAEREVSLKKDPLRASVEAKTVNDSKSKVEMKYHELEAELRKNLKPETEVLEPQILVSSTFSPPPNLSRTTVLTPAVSYTPGLDKGKAPRKFSPISKKSTNTSINQVVTPNNFSAVQTPTAAHKPKTLVDPKSTNKKKAPTKAASREKTGPLAKAIAKGSTIAVKCPIKLN